MNDLKQKLMSWFRRVVDVVLSARVKLLAMFVVGLVFGSAVGYVLFTSPQPRVAQHPIGIVYPFSGRLAEWGCEAMPIIEAAERDIDAMLETMGSKVRFKYVVKTSETTPEGALRAVQELVETHGVQVIVGLPLSGNLQAVKNYIDSKKVTVISSASTAVELCTPDRIFRISSPENYKALIGSRLAIELGYNKVVVVYRNDTWAKEYMKTIVEVFNSHGFPAESLCFEIDHTYYRNYTKEVAELSEMVSRVGADEHLLVYLIAWENEDYSILAEARKDAVLSNVRWFSAVLYPSMLSESVMWGLAYSLRDFAIKIRLWGAESRPTVNPLVLNLMNEAKSKLGRFPSFEHVYMYDALMLAALSIINAGKYDGEAVAKVVPIVASMYYGATGHKMLDKNGDLSVDNIAYIGVVKTGEGDYTFMYFAYYAGDRDEFTILPEPEPRTYFFSPQA